MTKLLIFSHLFTAVSELFRYLLGVYDFLGFFVLISLSLFPILSDLTFHIFIMFIIINLVDLFLNLAEFIFRSYIRILITFLLQRFILSFVF